MTDYLVALVASVLIWVAFTDPSSGLVWALKRMYQQYAFLISIPW